MPWLYRLQHTVALTTLELRTLGALVLLFAAGHVARAVQASAAPPLSPRLLVQQAQAVQQRAAVPTAALAAREDSLRTVARADAAGFAAELRAAKALEARTEAAEHPARTRKADAPIPRMNLNTATQAQLELLPRVGPALATRILDYRRTHSGFRRPAELTEVKGIGEKTLEKLLPYVFVE